MTTFSQFILLENDDLVEAAQIIKRDCKPWIKASKKKPIYRGMRSLADADAETEIDGILYKAEVRGDRRPLDSPRWYHDVLDEYFEKKFRIPFRTVSVFGIASRDIAKQYGYVYYIYPIGDFDYCWSPTIADATAYLESFEDRTEHLDLSSKEMFMYDAINGNYLFNTGLTDALSKKVTHEVMINASHYYISEKQIPL